MINYWMLNDNEGKQMKDKYKFCTIKYAIILYPKWG